MVFMCSTRVAANYNQIDLRGQCLQWRRPLPETSHWRGYYYYCSPLHLPAWRLGCSEPRGGPSTVLPACAWGHTRTRSKHGGRGAPWQAINLTVPKYDTIRCTTSSDTQLHGIKPMRWRSAGVPQLLCAASAMPTCACGHTGVGEHMCDLHAL